MRLLLDTYALIWLFLGDERLTAAARDAIADEDNPVFASAATAWEVAAKYRKGKLPEAAELAQDFEILIAEQGIEEIPITSRHAKRAGLLDMHGDPFDRMIVAQALVEDMAVVSNEAAFDALGVVRIW